MTIEYLNISMNNAILNTVLKFKENDLTTLIDIKISTKNSSDWAEKINNNFTDIKRDRSKFHEHLSTNNKIMHIENFTVFGITVYIVLFFERSGRTSKTFE